MLLNFPRKLMYRKVLFDGQCIWLPRFGFTKSQKSEIEHKAKKIMRELIFE